MVFIRFLVMLLIVQTVVFVCLSIYSRLARREKLETEFEARMAADPALTPAAKDSFIRDGLADYNGSMRRKLILLVYVVPIAAIGTIIYTVNHM